jgi:hypothetical protein
MLPDMAFGKAAAIPADRCFRTFEDSKPEKAKATTGAKALFVSVVTRP